MVMIAEPKKYRTVTKGLVEMKIVLDLVNKICSNVLKKVFPSSYGGLAEGDHPWSLYRGLYQGDLSEMMFSENKDGQSSYIDSTTKQGVQVKEYKCVYASSTDFSCATDYFNKELA